jgi:hypothetical protein
MTEIVAELKGKLAELDARIERLRADLAVAEDQRKAVLTVIGVYDPDEVKEVTQRAMRSDRSTPARQVTDLLKGRDLRRGILETLRDAETPLFATDVYQRYLSREGLEAAAEGLAPRLSSRFSGLLNKLEQDGFVRAEDAPDGRRRLWEIAKQTT